MLVLVTQADGSARRLPWFSYALAIVLASFFVLHHFAGGEGVADTEPIVAEALLYFQEHPVVELDPRLATIAGVDYAEELREAYIDDRRARGLPLLSERISRLMQEEFDGLVEQAHLRIDQLPAWRLGVKSGDRPAVTTLAHVVVHTGAAALLLSLLVLLLVGSALEDGWGHSIFGAFCLAAIALGGAASRGLGYYEQAGVPWIGASGLAAALLGAHLVRSLPGSPRLFGAVPLPGWLLLPVWLCAEYLLVRRISSAEDFVPVLAAIHGVCLGVGVVFGAGMMIFKVEKRLLERAVSSVDLISKPGLERAMQARTEERPEEAFDLLRREFRRSGGDRDVALAFWDVARELGRPGDAVAAALIVLRGDLRAGQAESAVRLWLELSDKVADLHVDPTLCVRMGEALLDEGHPDEAIGALGRAVEADDYLSPVMARRVVRIARDLDPDLTRSAAAIALRDPQLDPGERQQLLELTRMLESESADATAAPGGGADASQSVFAPRPEAASPVITEVDSHPSFAGEASQEPAVAAEPATGEALGLAGTGDAVAAAPEGIGDLDPHALSLDAIQEDFGRGLEDDETDSWNQPGLLPGLDSGLDSGLDFDIDSGVDSGLDSDFYADIDAGLGESTGEFDLDGDELDIDPMELEQAAAAAGLVGDAAAARAEQEPTEPIIQAGVAAAAEEALPPSPPVLDDQFDHSDYSDHSHHGEDDDDAQTRPLAGRGAREQPLRLRLGEGPDGQAEPKAAPSLRPLRIRTALPLRIEPERLVIEVDGGGKTGLPFARIGAVAVAAVQGIAAKPVVIVDFAVNWGTASGPLKLIRLRSDRYDPRALVQDIAPDGAASAAGLPALEALRIFLGEVVARSSATPLPDAEAATGQTVATYASLADYHRDVLLAEEQA